MRTARAIMILLLAAAAAFGSDARRVKTRLAAPKTNKKELRQKLKTNAGHGEEFDRIKEHLNFMAYDKKASADKETFFVDNGSTTNLKAIEIEITYYNEAGKQIHRRTVEIEESFPANETRKVDIASWDRQKSFHYINSVPSKQGSTPYTVRFRVVSFTPEGSPGSATSLMGHDVEHMAVGGRHGVLSD